MIRNNRKLTIVIVIALILVALFTKDRLGYYCNKMTFYYHYHNLWKIAAHTKYSNLVMFTHNDEYLAIVNGGYKYVPFILEELKHDETMHYAMMDLTKVNIWEYYKGQLVGKSPYDLWGQWWKENKSVSGVYIPDDKNP